MSVPVARHETRPTAEHFKVGELSLLVFGPGRGEAQVLILPDGSLGVIDGCREPRNGDRNGRGDPVREFINDWLVAHPNQRIRFVALTHPHDDHYAGLGRLIEAHDDRIDRLWRAQMTDRWATAYLKYCEAIESSPDNPPDLARLIGLQRVFAAFKERLPRIDVLGARTPMISENFAGRRFCVTCVAPSLKDIDRTQQELMDCIREDKLENRFDPNLTSAALIIAWGNSKMLLGGDLLCGRGALEGWSAAAPLISGRFQVLKVAHHASEQAQDLDLLQKIKPQISIVTPFQEAGGSQPPRPADIERLASISTVAITSPPRWLSEQGRPRPLDPPLPTPEAMPTRNGVILSVPAPPPSSDAVCVSLTPTGRITKLLLTGRARRYQLP
jgi:hypothetical protein